MTIYLISGNFIVCDTFHYSQQNNNKIGLSFTCPRSLYYHEDLTN
jgi:hypothetical protein